LRRRVRDEVIARRKKEVERRKEKGGIEFSNHLSFLFKL
jgi:hypothetical protein